MMTKMFRRFVTILIAVVIAANAVTPAFADDPDFTPDSNEYRTRNNIIFYDPNDFNGTCIEDTNGTTGSLQGNTNREKAFRYFLSKGLSGEQSAGIVGNLMVESGMIPDNQEDSQSWENGGWGLAQWTGSRRTDIKKAVEAAGLPYTNEKTPANVVEKLLAFELNFLWEEATKRGDIESLKKDTAGDFGSNQKIEKAVISWERHFEIAGNPALGARYTHALKAFKDFGGSGSVDPDSQATNPDTSTLTLGCAGAPKNVDGDFVYYSQYDPAWANVKYGNTGKTVLSSGCGPTSMAMIVATLTGDTGVTPKVIATKYSKFYIPGVGSSHGLFSAVATDYGLNPSSVSKDETKVKSFLDNGGLIVSGGSGPAPYTSSGHVIVIRKTTDGGKYLVGNPLPAPKDQGKSSATVVQNVEWFNTAYSWAQLAGNSSGMVGIAKK